MWNQDLPRKWYYVIFLKRAFLYAREKFPCSSMIEYHMTKKKEGGERPSCQF
jgi:hypothetical protein